MKQKFKNSNEIISAMRKLETRLQKTAKFRLRKKMLDNQLFA
jgi:hypothetical protein